MRTRTGMQRMWMFPVALAFAVAGCGADGGAGTGGEGSHAAGAEGSVAGGGQGGGAGSEAAALVTVYKSPTCGCCSAWVDHMREAGFEVEAHDVDDLSAVKIEHGIAPQHQACHTALVGGYVIEGHVPADLVKQMLDEKPEIAGLAVPGMPRGSPGMEVAGGVTDPYDVIAFTAEGESSVYASR